MSQSNSILNLLGITDKSFIISSVTDGVIGKENNKRHIKLIEASLTYPKKTCPQCGFATLIKNGMRLTNARILSLNGLEYHMKLKKQRYYCKKCGSTCGAQSPFLSFNQSMTTPIKEMVVQLSKDSIPHKTIAKIIGVSQSTVARLLYGGRKLPQRASNLPEHLCFDEFRSTGHLMSFIACDAETHKLISLLPDRLSKTIIEYFENRYSLTERPAVKSVVIDLNANYQNFIHRLFPNAQTIIDRFHLVQLAGRALDQSRLELIHRIENHKSREYKILKSQWKLFHKHSTKIDAIKPVFLFGINEYMTQQNAVDLGLEIDSKFRQSYEIYQALLTALDTNDPQKLEQFLTDYKNNHSVMDTVIRTFKKNLAAIKNSCTYLYSNGPLEGLNRKIKQLKRSCYGFRNQNNFFIRINLICA